MKVQEQTITVLTRPTVLKAKELGSYVLQKESYFQLLYMQSKACPVFTLLCIPDSHIYLVPSMY